MTNIILPEQNNIPSNCYAVYLLTDPDKTVRLDLFVDNPNGITAQQDYINCLNNWVEQNITYTTISAFDINGNFITPAPENCTLVQNLDSIAALNSSGALIEMPAGYQQILNPNVTLPLQYDIDGITILPAPNGYAINVDNTEYQQIIYQAIPSAENTSYLQKNIPDSSLYQWQPATQNQIDNYNIEQNAIVETNALKIAKIDATQEVKNICNNSIIINFIDDYVIASNTIVENPITYPLKGKAIDSIVLQELTDATNRQTIGFQLGLEPYKCTWDIQEGEGIDPTQIGTRLINILFPYNGIPYELESDQVAFDAISLYNCIHSLVTDMVYNNIGIKDKVIINYNSVMHNMYSQINLADNIDAITSLMNSNWQENLKVANIKKTKLIQICQLNS